MGQGQSSDDGHAAAGPRKTCYYESLGVSQQATDDEIKKGYRRKALELHPDRNYGNVEEATRQFAEVQRAYEVLSDPHERAWYDNHRDTILRGDTGAEEEGEVYEGSVRVTTSEDITKLYLNFDGRLDLSDSPSSFFTQLRQFFDKLSDEEVLSSEPDDAPSYPSFGKSTDAYAAGVRQFYSAWSGFSTRKSFAWKDMYRLSEAPDRRTRRLMEKENTRLRQQGIKEFNEAVRALVSFIKKRDPRYAPNSQTEEERQKALRDQAAAQAAKDRAANQAAAEAYVLPDWAKGDQPKDEHEGEFEESSEEVEQVYECVVCNKVFKSESQFDTHEKSKKHKKSVHELEKQMRKENRDLGLDSDTPLDTPEAADEQHEEANAATAKEHQANTSHEDAHVPASDTDTDSHHQDHKQPSTPSPAVADSDHSAESDPDSIDSDYAPRAAVEARLAGTDTDTDTDDLSADLQDSTLNERSADSREPTLNERSDSASPAPKLGAAKLKRQKRDAAAKAKIEGTEFRCVTCQAGFPSKTKLFTHINEVGHAKPVSVAGGGVKGKKKGRR